MRIEEYRAFKRQAGVEGLYVGLLWVASFVCFAYQFQAPSMVFLSLFLGLGSPALLVVRLKRYRDCNLNATLSFFNAFTFALTTYLYASLIMAAGQWAYFQFLDNGQLLQGYMAQVSSPEFKEMVATMEGLDEKTFTDAIDQLAEQRPIDLALHFLTSNIFIGFLLSLPTALFCWRRERG